MKLSTYLTMPCKVALMGLAAFALFTAPALAQQTAGEVPDTPSDVTSRNTPVAVEVKGSDALGAKLGLRLKEMLNNSNLFSLNTEDTPKFRIVLSTVPEFESRPNVGSAYSVTWVFALRGNMLSSYLDTEIGILTEENVDAIATKILERTDGMSARYSYLFPPVQAN